MNLKILIKDQHASYEDQGGLNFPRLILPFHIYGIKEKGSSSVASSCWYKVYSGPWDGIC